MASLQSLLALATLTAGCAATADGSSSPRTPRRPNVIVILTDDQGYGDLSSAGHPTILTPHLDALAASGTRLTQFYAPSSVCSPSRAALLTGCYPKRVDMHRHVVFPPDDFGLHPDEVTLAEVLRAEGYATACIGKWHLGHRPGLLPTDQGFDTFFGVPYSNDMSQFHRAADTKYRFRLPLMRDSRVVEWEPDQHELTRRYTEQAVGFIEAHAREPFLLYLPHSMPHLPLYASRTFAGRSAGGTYGDVIEEIDWSVGEIVAALEREGLREDTLLVFTSDNGPRLQQGLAGGSAGPLRGGKGSTWEGGQRVPCIASWPGRVPAGLSRHEVVTMMDLLPTVAALVGAELPRARVIDGHDASALLLGEAGAVSPSESFLYYASKGGLEGVRRGPWKLFLESGELYQLERDIGERRDVAAERPRLVEELRALALALDAEISAAARPRGSVDETLFDPQRP